MAEDRVGILGATGMVGQRFIQLLSGTRGLRSRGLPRAIAPPASAMTKRCAGSSRRPFRQHCPAAPLARHPGSGTPDHLRRARCRHRPRAGAAICRRRMRRHLKLQRLPHAVRRPLVIPEVNAAHLALLEQQSWRRSPAATSSPIRTAPPSGWCSRSSRSQIASASRASSSAPCRPSAAQAIRACSLDILGNVVPFIRNEEEKLEAET